jgi:hypothetical protein
LALEVSLTPRPLVQSCYWFSIVEEMLHVMVKKTLDQHVLPNLALVVVVSINFDLWMFCMGVHTFVIVINFLNYTWVPMHIIMGLLEANETIG